LGHEKLPAYEAAVCGSVAGGIAAALTTPLDVLKTRVMLDLRVRSASSPSLFCPDLSQKASQGPPPTVLKRLASIYIDEGWRALFAGVVPRTLWISAGGAVFLGMYEFTMNNLLLR